MSGAPVAIVIAIIVTTSSYVSAQTESLALCLPGYTMLYNSLGQTPCTIAAALGGACHNNVFTVEPLEVGDHYVGPTLFDGESCLCSTVYYSLLSACGYCQGHTFLDWSAFDVNCSIVYDQVFSEPIPSSTRIPHYAYLDVVADNTFNVTLALSAGGVESTPVLQATGTSTTTLASAGSSTAANMASSTSVALASDSTLTAWEIGVVVVVVVVFLGIVAVAVIVLRRRNSSIQYKSGGNIIMTNKQSGSGKLISQAQYSPLL